MEEPECGEAPFHDRAIHPGVLYSHNYTKVLCVKFM